MIPRHAHFRILGGTLLALGGFIAGQKVERFDGTSLAFADLGLALLALVAGAFILAFPELHARRLATQEAAT